MVLTGLLERMPALSPGSAEVSESIDPSTQVSITGVASNSRLAGPGDLYLGLPGERTHGASFARTALDAGAVAVLTDERGRHILTEDGLAGRAPVVVVADPRALMAGLAAEIYRRPSQAVGMLGVTGTNGKTTTAYLLDAGLRAVGQHTGLIGTLGFSYDGLPLTGDRTTVTTPESAELQGLLAALVERGADAVTMEVSSHALVLGRVDAIRFDVAGFTNFGADHLDFHGSAQAYFAAKAELFTAARARAAVINIDDPRGPELVDLAKRQGLPVTTTSVTSTTGINPDKLGGEGSGQADYVAARVQAGPIGSRVLAQTPTGPLEFDLGLPGLYNVHNALTALAMLAAIGVDPAAAAAGFAAVSVPGRMQRVELGPGGPAVYVDFAHTPQAVSSALSALADQVGETGEGGRLICVVGCGGDRDPDKRGPMGAAAVRAVSVPVPVGVDGRRGVVIVTDDNPRSEDPTAIRQVILGGARRAIDAEQLNVELIDGSDRRSALATALSLAAESDRPERQVIAVLGKGHEHGQEIGDRVEPFDDVAVVLELWSGLAARPGGER